MNSELHDTQIDRLVELYCTWRTEAAAVRAAYERLATAEPSERAVAFSHYEAALDREESAADTYAEHVGVVSASLGEEPHRRHTSHTRSAHAPAPADSTWIWRW